MKNKELIKVLQSLPSDLEIKIAIDDEGNGFRNVPDGWVGVEKFHDGDLIAEEDYEDYEDELEDYILIG